MAGAPIAAMLLSLNGVLGLRGWKWLFLLEGLPTIAFGFILKVRRRVRTVCQPPNAIWGTCSDRFDMPYVRA